MKKLTVFLCSLAMVFSIAGFAGAATIYFDVAGSPNSSVLLIDPETGITLPFFGTILENTTLTAALADNLANVNFSLGDDASSTFNFIKFETTGSGIGSFGINATLAFDNPSGLSGNFSGSGGWGTVNLGWLGTYSGGHLNWENSFRDVTLADANVVRIALEQGIAIVAGSSTNLRATVTNLGGGSAAAPVPEPSTILLMGAGLLGLVTIGRRKFNPKQ